MSIQVTDKAVSEVKRIIAEQGTTEKVYLRISVKGGGCSGFTHKLDLDEAVNDKTDDISEVNGINVVVDKRSALYCDGATIDFHDGLDKRGFVVSNPAAKTTCGCGSSFSM